MIDDFIDFNCESFRVNPKNLSPEGCIKANPAFFSKVNEDLLEYVAERYCERAIELLHPIAPENAQN